MPRNPFDRFLDAFRRSDAPFTMFLLLATVSAFLIALTSQGARYLVSSFAFVAPIHLAQPWRLFTYPILNLGIVSLLCDGLMLWFAGSSLERSWSTRGFAAFWLAASAVTALSLSVAAAIGGFPVGGSSFLVVSSVFVAWAMLNPELTIQFWGVIPIKAKWMALGLALYIFFSYAEAHFLLGFFALGGCAFAVWWTRFFASRSPFGSANRGFGYPAPPRQDTFFGGAGKPAGQAPSSPRGANGPKRPKKILTPLDDKRTWKDWGPLAAYQRYRRRKQFERLLDDE